MRLKLVDNMSAKLNDEFAPVLRRSNACRLAVAFVSTGGLSIVAPHIQRCVEEGGSIEFLVGLDLSATDP